MSTDDLARRARAHARVFPESTSSVLMDELADEVDRLQERDRLHSEAAETGRRIENAQLQRIIQVEAERDAARAEMERLRDMLSTVNTTAAFRTVLGLHVPKPGWPQVCVECNRVALGASVNSTWPCQTVATITATLTQEDAR